jgi:hypothetical protein
LLCGCTNSYSVLLMTNICLVATLLKKGGSAARTAIRLFHHTVEPRCTQNTTGGGSLLTGLQPMPLSGWPTSSTFLSPAATPNPHLLLAGCTCREVPPTLTTWVCQCSPVKAWPCSSSLLTPAAHLTQGGWVVGGWWGWGWGCSRTLHMYRLSRHGPAYASGTPDARWVGGSVRVL